MANKETKRERREAARKARLEAQRRAQRRSQVRKLWYSLAALAVLGVIIGAVILSGRADRALADELEELAGPAGCEVPASQPNEGRQHIDDVNAGPGYDTEPPTSGDHFGNWDQTGIHDVAIPDTIQVHNLEHGHVGVQYNDSLPDETIQALEDAVSADDEWAFIAPRPEMDVPLAFTAWTYLSRCDTPGSAEDVKAYAAKFIEARKNKGPEPDAPGDPR